MLKAIAAVLLLPAITVAAGLAPDAKVLKVEGATTVRLCMDCGPQQRFTFGVSVVPEAGKIVLQKNEQPRVTNVATGGTRIQQLEQRLKASWEPATGQPQMLVLTIDPPFRDPGTYDITIDLLPKTRPRAPAETVHMVVGAATLEGPDKLLVHRTRGLILPDELHATPLVLFETGRLAGVAKLDVQPMTFVHDNEPIDETVFTRRASDGVPPAANGPNGAPAVELAAGERLKVEYDISDAPPFGLTSGSVRVMAPEVAKALAIPVEIRSVLSREYLALAILFGLVASYFVKVSLQKRLQRSQARAAAATLLADVAADRSKFRDAIFQTATANDFNDLAAKVRRPDAAAIETARKALDTTWRTARQDLEKRRTEFRTLLNEWQKIVLVAWQLPPVVAPDLTAARQAGKPASTLEQDGDIDGAKASLRASEETAAADLDEHGRTWRQASRRFFDRLVAADAGISTAILAPLKSASDAWRAAFPLDPVPTRDPAQVQPLLRSIMGEYVTAGDYLRELPHHLRREFEQVSATLTENHADSARIEQVGRALEALTHTLASAIDDPAPAAEGIQGVLDALQQAWQAAFATAPTADAEAARAVLKKVGERDYRAAADLLGAGQLLADTGAAGAASAESFAAAFASPPRAEGASIEAGSRDAASPFAILLLDSLSDIRTAKLLQTAIVGGMFFVWALSTSSATFDGTIRGLLAAMFSAFGLDVGIDTLLAKVKGTVFG